MPVHYFKSSDAGAPVLTGQAGSLIELLDACLIDGYGDLDPAGWEIAFSDTDKRVYRSPTIGGKRDYYRVLNDGSGPGGDVFAYLRGYHTMTDVDTGSDPYPTPGQRTHGVSWMGSTVNDSSAREWSVIATDKTVVVFVLFFPSGSSTQRICLAFGEFQPIQTSDVGSAFVAGFSVDANFTSSNNALNRNAPPGSTQDGAWISSNFAGSVISVQAGMGAAGKGGSPTGWGVAGGPFPNPHIDGAVLSPVLIHDGLGVRGAIDLLFDPAHASAGYPGNDVEFTGLDGVKYCWQRMWNTVGGASANAALVARVSE